MRLGRNGQLGGSMTKTEMAVLLLSLGALALSAATLLGANSLTSRLGERLELTLALAQRCWRFRWRFR